MSEKDKLLVKLVKEVLKKRKRRKRAKKGKKVVNSQSNPSQSSNSVIPPGYIVNKPPDNRFNPGVMANNTFGDQLRIQNDILAQNQRKYIDNQFNDLNSRNQKGFKLLNDDYNTRFNDLADKLNNIKYLENNNPSYDSFNDGNSINNGGFDNFDDGNDGNDYFDSGKHAVVPTSQGSDFFLSEYDRDKGDTLQNMNNSPQISPNLPKPEILFQPTLSSSISDKSLRSIPSVKTQISNNMTNNTDSDKIIPRMFTKPRSILYDIDFPQTSRPTTPDTDIDAQFHSSVKIKPKPKMPEIDNLQDVPQKSPKKPPKTQPPADLMQLRSINKDKSTKPDKQETFIVEDVEEDEKPTKSKKSAVTSVVEENDEYDQLVQDALKLNLKSVNKETVSTAFRTIYSELPPSLKKIYKSSEFDNKPQLRDKVSYFKKMRNDYKAHLADKN